MSSSPRETHTPKRRRMTPPAAPDAIGNTMEQFVLFGDSITQQSFSPHLSYSFGSALADVYVRKLDIVNRGLSGYNSTQALRALPLCIPDADNVKIRFLTIFFGANDARLPGTPGGPDQSVPVEEYRQNIQRMVRHPAVLAHENIRIILITPPPIDERKSQKADQEKYRSLGVMMRRSAQNTAAYAQAIRELGQELEIPVLDIHKSILARCGYSHSSTPMGGSAEVPPNVSLQEFLVDGLHFSGEAYRLLFGELMGLIEKEWPDQIPAQLPMRLPAWDAAAAWAVDQEGRTRWEEEVGSVVSGRFEAVVDDVKRRPASGT